MKRLVNLYEKYGFARHEMMRRAAKNPLPNQPPAGGTANP
jgi:hypothetical protein